MSEGHLGIKSTIGNKVNSGNKAKDWRIKTVKDGKIRLVKLGTKSNWE